jgi:hypothetical protein
MTDLIKIKNSLHYQSFRWMQNRASHALKHCRALCMSCRSIMATTLDHKTIGCLSSQSVAVSCLCSCSALFPELQLVMEKNPIELQLVTAHE